MGDEPAVGCTIGEVVLDALRGELRIPGAEPVALSPMEADFLLYLARRHGQLVSKAELLHEVWRYSANVKSRAVDATLIRVRSKLEGTAIRIESLHGRGLQLIAGSPPSFDLATSVPVVPRERADVPLFGREADLERLEVGLGRGVRRLQLIGPAGMGKTSLGWAWAQRVGARRVDLRGITSSAALRRSVAASLGIEGDDMDARVAATLAKGPPTALDHGEGLDDEAESLLAGWMANGDVPILVSSQRLAKLPGEVVVLTQLERPPSELLVQRARAHAGLEPLPAEALDALWSTFGGHPLALRIAAPLVEWMQRPSDILDLEPGGEPISLASAVSMSLAHLSEDAIDVLHALASFSRPPAAAWVLGVVGLPSSRVLLALGELRQAGLVSAVDGTTSALPAVRTVLRGAEVHRATRDRRPARHVAWLLSLPATHAELGPLRGELEGALHRMPPDQRLPVLTRHLLMLYAYGPSEDLVPEADRWAAELPVEQFADGQEQRAWARFAFGDRKSAASILRTCVDHVGDPALRARGTALLSMLHAWWGEPDASELADRALALIPSDVPPFLRLDTLTFLGNAWTWIDAPRGRELLERVVVDAGARYPVRGLNAAISLLRSRPDSPWELDRARWLMGRAAAWLPSAQAAILDADLAVVLLGAGERDEAVHRLTALRALHREHPTPAANALLMDAAMRLVLFPALSLELLAEIDPEFSLDFAAVVRSVARRDPEAGLPPELIPYVDAMTTGAPLPEPTTGRAGWVRARFEIARRVAGVA